MKIRGTRNGYRVRAGDHRILYEVSNKAREVPVARVTHPREAYRDP